MASVKERLNAYFTSNNQNDLRKLFEDVATDLATLKTKLESTQTKLDADAGVTDTNYASLGAVGTLLTQQ
jgi:Skp family chaperone for outer membrane proteins